MVALSRRSKCLVFLVVFLFVLYILFVFCRPHESEYKQIMPKMIDIFWQHKKQLEPGEPQLNLCDPAVMVLIPFL